jgi:lysophospholipase L1-like esterase
MARRPAPRPGLKGKLVSAGQILGVGLVCFGVWLVFDAKQLYDSALTAPLGTRRSVALSILRPIADLTNAIDLSRPVSGLDRALGRTGTPGGSVGPGGPGGITGPTSPPGGGHPGRGGAPTPTTQPVRPSGGTTPTTTTLPTPTTTTLPAALRPILPPSPAHPLTVLDIGDSIGEDLGFGLGDEIGGRPGVKLVEDAVGSTGLAALDYYNWPAELELELREYHPRIVVVMLGGNDAQNFDVGKRYVGFGTPLWRVVYGGRVATMMRDATSAGARVVWVGLPVMSPESTLSDTDMQIENSVYAAEAAAHPGVIFVSTWKTLANAAGQYSEYLPNSSGDLVEVRSTDGIHIDAPGGTDLLAQAVVASMDRAFKLKL